MPLFRGITVTVHTPFAIDGLPETPLPAPSKTTHISEEDNKYASVFVPGHAQALFWLSYSVEAPLDETFFVFKLFINTQHVVTWCCDEEQQWQGKVQFALFKSSADDGEINGGAGMEKRALQFGDIGPSHDEDRCVEVKVFRANCRTRVPRQLMEGQDVTVGNGIQLPDAGRTKRGHPRKFYSFNLIDPKDDPFATFRFYYRSNEEIVSLNNRIGKTRGGGDRVVTAPGRRTVIKQVPTGKLIKAQGVRKSRLPQPITRMPSSSSSPPTPPTAPSSPASPPTPSYPPPAIPRSAGQVNLRRLSIPPSTILRPLLEHGPLPTSPTKQIDHGGSPNSSYHLPKAKKDTSGMFRSLFQSAKSRRAEDSDL